MKPLLPAYATPAALSVQCTYIIALQIADDYRMQSNNLLNYEDVVNSFIRRSHRCLQS